MDIEAVVPAKIGDPDAEGERERLRQTQQLLGLDLVGGAGPQQRLQQPELQVGDAGGHLPGQEKVALRLRGAKDFPIHQSRDELLHRFLARGPVAPGREHSALHLGRREIVLESQQTTDDLGGVSEERVRQRRHAPMQPDSLLARDAGQQRHGPIPQRDSSLAGCRSRFAG